MGKLITAEFSGHNELTIVAGVEHSEDPDIGKTFDGVHIHGSCDNLPSSDVWVDFSIATPAVEHARIAVEGNIPIVVASTGFDEAQQDELAYFAQRCPVLLASNLSVGIGVMDRLVGDAARLLGDDFDPALIEVHHSTKRDSPSGTALRLIERISAESGKEPQVAAIRAGGTIGEHQIRFIGQDEELIITHRAWSRQAFSRGVERAVRFIVGCEPGLYSIRDIYEKVTSAK